MLKLTGQSSSMVFFSVFHKLHPPKDVPFKEGVMIKPSSKMLCGVLCLPVGDPQFNMCLFAVP